MSLIRPDLAERLRPWREVGVALLLALAGAWIALRGGWILFLLGLALWSVAGGWALTAFRRTRFRSSPGAPGVVEVDEGQIGYFGPDFGGFVAAADLTEIRLVDFRGQRHWRLRTSDGQVLSIPTGAVGADRLFDAFAALPDIDMGAIAAALTGPVQARPLWSRPPRVGPGEPSR
jgi:hypothetical protein